MAWAEITGARRYWLRDARVPGVLADLPVGVTPDREGFARLDLRIEDGRIAALVPAGAAPANAQALDLDGGQVWDGQVWPGFVDMHTHIDKGHIWPRAPNPDGSFAAALGAVGADRARHWRAEDLRRRMGFSLASAYAHGTRALRTHIDSQPPQHAISWPVFARLRDEWAGRITLQGVSLVLADDLADAVESAALADCVADHGGVLGAVCFGQPDLAELLGRLFTLARDRDLDVDLHVDETLDPAVASLDVIAETTRAFGYEGRVTAGHCCALSVQPAEVVAATAARLAAAGVTVVSLAMCNLYLQDRAPGRTPRLRGIAPVHELAAAGVSVAFASDNTRDPFYAYGDLDMLEVFRESVRAGHLDHPFGAWPRAVTLAPARAMRLGGEGRIAAGAPADLVLFRARGFTELLSRPQTERIVIRAGRAIDVLPPDYRDLDDLFPPS